MGVESYSTSANAGSMPLLPAPDTSNDLIRR